MSSMSSIKLVAYVLYVLIVTCLCKPPYNIFTNKHNIFADQQRGNGYQNRIPNMDPSYNRIYERLKAPNGGYIGQQVYPPFYQNNELPPSGNGGGGGAPKYMLELYNKFETDRYSHPMANIVRSFVNINEGEDETHSKSNKTKPGMRRHMMKFNISSVSRDEEVHLAELRLFTLVEADRKNYYGNDRRVSIYEYNEELSNENYVSPYELLAKKEIYGSYSGWETFTITEPFKRWVKSNIEVKTIEVRIETVLYSHYTTPDLDVESKPHRENEPLLIVFSNDKRKRKSEQRELHEMFMHYTDDIVDNAKDDYGDNYEYWDYDGNYEDNKNHNNNGITKRDTDSLLKRIQEYTSNKDKIFSKQFSDKTTIGNIKNMTSLARKEMLKMLYQQILDIDVENSKKEQQKGQKQLRRMPRDVFAERVKRSRYKKRKGRRNICKRKPLVVKFKDIHWENWIIAPQFYNAYECTGRCYFPMGDHLTPTKHAIIQTLLHTNHPNKATRACCVPTKLSPISILYMDEKGVVTYKYKYEGMVVAECGCR